MLERLTGTRTRRVLFGNDARGGRNVTVALLGSSIAFTFLFNVAFIQRTALTPAVRLLWWEPGALLLFGIAAVTAYRFGGLCHCWAIGFAPTFAAMVNMLAIGFGMGANTGSLEILGTGILGGVVGAIVLGTPGYVLGAIVARFDEGVSS